jgi:hypothetical protein
MDQPAPPPESVASLNRLIFGVLAMVLAAAGLAAILLLDMPPEKLAIASGFVGTIFGWAGASFTFYFGTSQGSVDKGGVITRVLGGIGR